jgi:ubiquinone biosynthesis protein COQ9
MALQPTASGKSAADDLTLEELRIALAPRIAAAAVFDGWSPAAVEAAASEVGVDRAVAAYAFPGGAMDMIAAWIAHVDVAMVLGLPVQELAAMPVHKRVRRLLEFRLAAITGQEEALRRAIAIMAMPQNAARSLRLGWASADAMWRLAGDTAADYNYYTKRATLAAIYAATLAVFVDDRSEGKADTYAFLDRRLAGVARFERAKAQLTAGRGDGFSFARLLGRLRYPAR